MASRQGAPKHQLEKLAKTPPPYHKGGAYQSIVQSKKHWQQRPAWDLQEVLSHVEV